ncbi:ABC transporter permease [Snuella lapsa]|uniref:ABC transporter permease n=1 Tax=Snuella lapsa TaxID=870481 RepID=A0ABP6WUH8_9FLAO
MIQNYLKLAWRNLIKNKVYSLINIGGLAIGVTAYLLIIQYVNFESSYDTYHSHIDDLYRVTLSTDLGSYDGIETAAATHPAVASAMKKDFPEVESFARVVDKEIMLGSFVLSYRNKQGNLIKSNVNNDMIYLADSTILDLFKINLVKGNPKTALKDKRSVILSTKMATRFFGNENPINKTLMANGDVPVNVTGVFEELPENTHLKFDMLVSFSTLGPWTETTWNWPEFYNYLRLKPGTDPAIVEAKFPEFVKKYLGELMQEHSYRAEMGLQPVKDIHLKSHLANEISVNNNEKTLNFLWLIAIFVILIALMNFINLSTAKSTERALEVGLKKVVGIKKGALIGQFLTESLVINCIAIIMAIILISIIIKPFNDFLGLPILSMNMWLTPSVWGHIIVLLLLGGVLAGIYPTFVLSSFKPIQVLKGKFDQSGKGAFIRKVLVVSQFTISITLIAGTYIMYSQFTYMQNQDLGFDAKHNLVVNAPMVIDSTITDKLEVFKGELLKNPNINIVTVTKDVPGKKNAWYNTTRQVHEEREASVICNQFLIDHDFMETYQVKLLAGRNFRKEDHSFYGFRGDLDLNVPHRVMLNRAAVGLLGFSSVEEAVNKKITFQLGPQDRTAEVIGVMENYHQQSLQNDYDPTVFLYPEYYYAGFLTLNINAVNIESTIHDIEKKYEALFPQDPYNYFFLDEHFNKQYKADRKFGQLFILFATLGIFIAALGLFGLGSYMAMRRTKELCVRKVLGASKPHVLFLIPKSLLVLVVVSGLIAIPITYLTATEWLSNYAFRVSMNPFMFIVPMVLVTAVALLSVLPESLKVTLVKPANYLRNE